MIKRHARFDAAAQTGIGAAVTVDGVAEHHCRARRRSAVYGLRRPLCQRIERQYARRPQKQAATRRRANRAPHSAFCHVRVLYLYCLQNADDNTLEAV